jgi:3-hydroxy-3-methylglutaryl CoA synthase
VEILGVGPLPAWVNRFAVNADYCLEASQTALTEVKKAWKASADSLQHASGWIQDKLTIGALSLGAHGATFV